MLCGEKVILRAIERADLPDYVRWINDPDVQEFLLMREPFSLAQEEQWYESALQNPSARFFAIEVEGQHIGGCGLQHIDWLNRSAELGIFIGEKALWGQGLGTDATRALVRHGFEELNLHRIQLQVFANNQRAIPIYEKVGFTHEGRERDGRYQHGSYIDVLRMSILDHEWRGLSS